MMLRRFMRKTLVDPFTVNLPTLDLHGETRETMIAPLNSFLDENIKLRNQNVIIIEE